MFKHQLWRKLLAITQITRSTETVHISAKARHTSGEKRILITDPDPIRIRIRIRIRNPDRHQNLTICSLAHCQPSLKMLYKSVWKFLRKVANSQTNR